MPLNITVRGEVIGRRKKSRSRETARWVRMGIQRGFTMGESEGGCAEAAAGPAWAEGAQVGRSCCCLFSFSFSSGRKEIEKHRDKRGVCERYKNIPTKLELCTN